MKFKKRLLSEEIGLPKSNKKTFTNGKKQKVVVSEEQLQRLINLINEKDKDKDVETTGPTNPKPQDKKAKPCPDGQIMGKHGCVSVKPKDGSGENTSPANKPCRKCCKEENGDIVMVNPQAGQPCKCPKSKPEVPCKDMKKKKCCKCRGQKPYSVAQGKSCPKSCPEVPCKGTPPTNPGGVTEGRKLKTTNPISESEIKDMKKWFKRVNRTGINYNPSID